MAIKNEIIALLQEVDQGKYSNIALNELFHRKVFKKGEKNFITEVFYGVIRNKIYLDYMISQKVKEVKKDWLQQLFRLSFYQIRFMKSDDKGVIWEGVELAKKKYGVSVSRFVNGVLRNFQRSFIEEEENLKREGREEVLFSYPKWFFEQIKKESPERYIETLKSLKRTPLLSVRVNLLKYSCEEFEEYLRKEEIEIIKKVETVYYTKAGNLLNSSEFQEGKIIVQDAASYLAAKNLGAKPGEIVLDTCSAPGGKTSVLAEAMKNEGQILSLDIHTHKIKLIQENCKKLGITIVQAVKLDARHLSLQGKKYDRILVDAPCSGYGVLAKKPEGLYNKKEENIKELVTLQREILTAAAEVLKVGGEMVYSTCTILPAENQENAKWFLETHPNFESIQLQIPENVAGTYDDCGGFSIDYQEEVVDSFYMIKWRKNLDKALDSVL